MIDFNILKRRFREFGGWRLVKEYAKLGLVMPVVKELCRCVVKRKSLKAIYPVVRSKVCPMLIARYKHILKENKQKYTTTELTHEHPKIVWWCWLQGEENAPAIITACLNSLRKHLPSDYDIRIIDNQNWNNWVELPDYIIEKKREGKIPHALFSDLLRLELLIKYGGTWIDSSVLCTGIGGSSSCSNQEQHCAMDGQKLLEADLFLFQYTPRGSSRFTGISNWFISAHSKNIVLMTMRDILMAYWRDYDCTLDYYIFHLFFDGLAKAYPEEVAAMPYAYSPESLVLMNHWHEPFVQAKWDKLTSKVCFHKLSNRPKSNVLNQDGNYYKKIIEAFKERF